MNTRFVINFIKIFNPLIVPAAALAIIIIAQSAHWAKRFCGSLVCTIQCAYGANSQIAQNIAFHPEILG